MENNSSTHCLDGGGSDVIYTKVIADLAGKVFGCNISLDGT